MKIKRSFAIVFALFALLVSLVAMPMTTAAASNDVVVIDNTGGATATADKTSADTIVASDPCTGEGVLFSGTIHTIVTPKGFKIVISNAKLSDGSPVVYVYLAISANAFDLILHVNGHHYFLHFRIDDNGNVVQILQVDNCEF
jgi:hypothetical protein